MDNFLFVTEQRNLNTLGEHTPTLINVNLETFRTEMPLTVEKLQDHFDSSFGKALSDFESFSTIELCGICGHDGDFNWAFEQIKKKAHGGPGSHYPDRCHWPWTLQPRGVVRSSAMVWIRVAGLFRCCTCDIAIRMA